MIERTTISTITSPWYFDERLIDRSRKRYGGLAYVNQRDKTHVELLSKGRILVDQLLEYLQRADMLMLRIIIDRPTKALLTDRPKAQQNTGNRVLAHAAHGYDGGSKVRLIGCRRCC